MLDLWQPPKNAGEPIGCLATTYTFAPGLFDEQCLARFLEIESEPHREDLAFLIERESRLGGVYAGVVVDHTMAGVEHSLRWDVLPVRINAGKQHAKLSLLVWSQHVRIIVASANLTEPGYRTNHEVVATVELNPDQADKDALTDTVAFLRSLFLFIPTGAELLPEVQRAKAFLDQTEQQTRDWMPLRKGQAIRQQLVFTLPSTGVKQGPRSSLEEAVECCRKKGRSPFGAWIASPFFDQNGETNPTAAALCKLMARGESREIWFSVPAAGRDDENAIPRLAAPKTLLSTPKKYQATVNVRVLPEKDGDKNLRPWHAKMLALCAEQYSALMIGSSNFTCAGMGVGPNLNAEANLLTVLDRGNGREVGQIEEIWQRMNQIANPESAEWLGSQPDGEEELSACPPLPAGFLSATYCAGDKTHIVLRFDPDHLPENWRIHACGHEGRELLSAANWQPQGRNPVVQIEWGSIQPPEKLLVQWEDQEAFLPLNVQDSRELPPPAQIENMSAEDMLYILAAADPSAAFRTWAKQQQPSDSFDSSLDSATPIDLNPLYHYDLKATFLHRIRRRARVFAQLRANLQRPVWGTKALEWRLRGLVGIEPLADRLVRDFEGAGEKADEALLALTDFLIVLHEVNYQASAGYLPKAEFDEIFRAFLQGLAGKLGLRVDSHCTGISKDMLRFWERVLDLCRR